MSGPEPRRPVQQHGGAITVQGEVGLQLLAHCIRSAIREASARGVSTRALRRFHATVIAALSATSGTAKSGTGHEVANSVTAATESNRRGASDWFDVAETAAVLGVGRRQAQRIAQKLHGSGAARRIGTAWALRQAPVRALALERQREAQNGSRR